MTNRSAMLGTFIGGLLLAGSALAGNGALLGVQPGYPLVNFVSATTPQGASYNGTTMTITGTAVFVTFTPSGTAEFVSAGGLVINANINSAGTLSGGAFTIMGTVIDTNGTPGTGDDVSYSGTLLSGTIADYGIADTGGPGGTDLADLRMYATGGSMLTRFGGSGADIAASVTIEGSTFAGSFASNWTGATTKGDLGKLQTTRPFPCFNISSLSIKNRSGTANDEVRIAKGGIRLDAGDTFDPATDDVTLTLDDLVISIPAGSFVQKPGKEDFTYKTATGVKPKIAMRLNFDKYNWEFELSKGDVSLIDTSDGVTVSLHVGDYASTVTIFVSHSGGGYGSSSSSEHSHAPSCKPGGGGGHGSSSDSGTPGYGKMSSIAGLWVRTPNNVYVKKTRTLSQIGHPTTIFTDRLTGETVTIDTSGNTCLRCGDVVTGNNGGSFTISRIESRPGDRLSLACGVSNARCDILPPGM